MSRLSDPLEILQMWAEFEILQWADPISSPIYYWSPVTHVDEYALFVEEAPKWVPRALSSELPAFALQMNEDATQLWKDPRSHIPVLSWRGQACSKWRFDSSAQRIANRDFYNLDTAMTSRSGLAEGWNRTKRILNSLEDQLLKRSRDNFGKVDESDIQILAWAQHEGAKQPMPEKRQWATRLLDMTRDPMIALYFATYPCTVHEGDECDGRVIAIDDIASRKVTGLETKEEVRRGIGSIWRPSDQSKLQEIQKGEFLVMGVLPDSYAPMLNILVEQAPNSELPQTMNIEGREFPIIAYDADIIAQLANRMQKISVPGIHPAFLGGATAFLKRGDNEFPSNVAQSIRIAGSKKSELREFLKTIDICEEKLFPK